jgi:hypothetical protein
MYIERLRVVPTSASYIRGDGHLHLERDGDGHHQKDDVCHVQLEDMRMARHIWLYYLCVWVTRLRVVPTSTSYVDEDGHLHLERDGDGHHHHFQNDDDCHLQPEQKGVAHTLH